jgi:hypothetical protein
MAYQFKYNDLVTWPTTYLPNELPARYARVVGYATIPMAVIGAMVIVAFDQRISETYPFTTINMAESALKLVSDQQLAYWLKEAEDIEIGR